MPDICPEHHNLASKLDEIALDTKAILARLNAGDITFATTTLRLATVEKIVYGAVGLGLSGICLAVLSLALKVVK